MGSYRRIKGWVTGSVSVMVAAGSSAAWAQAPEPSEGGRSSASRWRTDTALGFHRFEQQVKTEVGGQRGERLVDSTELNLFGSLSYQLLDSLGVGFYAQWDHGSREAAQFVGFDADNKAVVESAVGAAYDELWIGPMLRAEWRRLFVELGYGAFGRRWDDARTDLASVSGDTAAALETSAAIAWWIGLGGALPVSSSWDVSFRLQYRVRYYVARNGEELAGQAVHGTQSYTPFIGAVYRFGRR
ncbi:MAG: hypothetical protein HRU17_09005 [Polyangiaceae bacterium]|nr:hypothetical protein [Polyangiaceae bacterium]